MPSYSSATRSVLVGLLLAVMSAGSLIAFSLFAGEADDPTGTTVTATRPDATVPSVVLGTRFGREQRPSRPDRAARVVVASPQDGTDSPPDLVLGIRIRAEELRFEKKLDGSFAPKVEEPQHPQGLGTFGCKCGKAHRKNTPNGHAYGHYKARSKRSGVGHGRPSAAHRSKPGRSRHAASTSASHASSKPAANSTPSGSPGNGNASAPSNGNGNPSPPAHGNPGGNGHPGNSNAGGNGRGKRP